MFHYYVLNHKGCMMLMRLEIEELKQIFHALTLTFEKEHNIKDAELALRVISEINYYDTSEDKINKELEYYETTQ